MWLDTMGESFHDWPTFERSFREQFCKLVQDQDRLNELQQRLQRKGETAAKFINEFRRLVSRFKRPPSKRHQVQMAFAQLRADYRRFLAPRLIVDLEAIVRYGGEYELHLQWDARHKDAPAGTAHSADKTAKVAAVEVPKTKKASTRREEPPPAEPKGRRRRRQRKSSATSNSTDEGEVARVSNRGPHTGRRMETTSGGIARDPAQTARGQSRPRAGASGAWQNRGPTQAGRSNAAWQQKPQQWRPGPAPTSGGGTLPHMAPPSQKSSLQAWAGAPVGRAHIGPCFVCNEAGHLANECPARLCYSCGQCGHSANQCAGKTTSAACQLCDTPGVTAKTCPNCAPFLYLVGNAKAGQ